MRPLRLSRWVRHRLGRHGTRQAAGAIAIVIGGGLLLSSLPGWFWVTAAGVALVVWGLAMLGGEA